MTFSAKRAEAEAAGLRTELAAADEAAKAAEPAAAPDDGLDDLVAPGAAEAPAVELRLGLYLLGIWHGMLTSRWGVPPDKLPSEPQVKLMADSLDKLLEKYVGPALTTWSIEALFLMHFAAAYGPLLLLPRPKAPEPVSGGDPAGAETHRPSAPRQDALTRLAAVEAAERDMGLASA